MGRQTKTVLMNFNLFNEVCFNDKLKKDNLL